MPNHYEPLLWTAASKGDLDGVKQYLTLGASPNYQNPDKNYWPVLFAAISAQSIAVVEVLLATHADVRLKDKQLLNAVQHALLRVGTQTTETLVQLLLDQPYQQISKAQLAAATGNLESLSEEPRSELLEVDLAGNSLAHYAAVNNQVEILEFLHHQVIDCFLKNAAREIPLYSAFAKKAVGAVGYLLSIAQSYESLANSEGWPLFNEVSKYDDPEIFQLVRNRFPEVNLNAPVDLYESDAGSSGTFGGRRKRVHYFSIADNSFKVDNWNPLLVAADFGCSTLIAYLIKQRGIQLNCTLNDGRTALCLAAGKGNLTVVQQLTSKKKTDINQFNPLYFAAKNGHFEIVLHLTSLPKIQLSQSRRGCDSALFAAIDKGYHEIAIHLISLLAPEWEALAKKEVTYYTSHFDMPEKSMLEPINYALKQKRFEILAEIMRTVERVGGEHWVSRLFFYVMEERFKERDFLAFTHLISFFNIQGFVHNNCRFCSKEEHACGKRNNTLHIAARSVWEEGFMFLLSYGVPSDLQSGVGQTARDILHLAKISKHDGEIYNRKERLLHELRTRNRYRLRGPDVAREIKEKRKVWKVWPTLVMLLVDYINRQAPNTLLYRGKHIQIERIKDDETQVHGFVPVLPNEPNTSALPIPNQPNDPVLPKELERKLQYYFSGTFFNQSKIQALKQSQLTQAEEAAALPEKSSGKAPQSKRKSANQPDTQTPKQLRLTEAEEEAAPPDESSRQTRQSTKRLFDQANAQAPKRLRLTQAEEEAALPEKSSRQTRQRKRLG